MLDSETLTQYAPVIVVIIAVLIQSKMFVTPEQLEKKHREILKDVEDKFVSINVFNGFKEQFNDMKEKIDKIYDCLIGGKL